MVQAVATSSSPTVSSTIHHTGPRKTSSQLRPTHNVVNLSDFPLTRDQLELLGLGLSFIPTPHPRRFCGAELVDDFKILRNTHLARYSIGLPVTANIIRDNICDAIEGELNRIRPAPTESNIPPRLRRALKELQDNKDIIVTSADKGDVVVIMNVSHYTDLAWKHLSDSSTYLPLSEDPTPTIVAEFNAYLRRCREDRVIDAGLYDRLKLPDDTAVQTMYFLPKIHKTPLKLRPIVSCSGGPTERASRYLNRLLQPHARAVDSYVENSIEVINHLRDLTLPVNTTLVSLDVESLYTNISHPLAIATFTRRFQDHPKFVLLLDLFKFVLFNNVLQFDGRNFKQTCGIAMGTSLAPALATIVVADLEEKYLNGCRLRPLCWWRFIDDVLAVWSHSVNELDEFTDGLNHLEPRIRFTVESSFLSTTFLDLRIYKPPDFATRGKLATSISYKPTNTFTYGEGSSHIASHTFRGIAIGETVRALRNTDTNLKFIAARRRLLRRFRDRNYSRTALAAIKNINFAQRENYLETRIGRRIERPLPLNTLYYKFPRPLNNLLRREWKRVYREPFLTEALPTAPFTAYRNHHSVGALLSHKRRTFHTIPCQATLQPDHMMAFAPQKFNRPRRRGVLIKTRPPITLRTVDLTCGNNRCLVCPRLAHPNYVASTVHQTTHPVDISLKCYTKGVVYLFTCRKCGKQYVGETAKCMRQRWAQHKVNFRTAPMTLYAHFIRYHHMDVLDVNIVLLCKELDTEERRNMERRWMSLLGTTVPKGLNNRP